MLSLSNHLGIRTRICQPLAFLFLTMTGLFFSLTNIHAQQVKGGDVTVFADSSEKGNTYALIIGINYSDRKQLKYPKLNYAVNDAEMFKTFISSGSFFDSIPSKNMRVLLDKKATIAEFGNAFFWLDTMVKKRGDKVIIYFSGHGIASGPDQGYLIAYDAPDVPDPSYFSFQGGTIPVSTLKSNIEKFRARGVFTYLFTDACRNNERKDSSLSHFQSILETNKGEIQFTSCSRNQSSFEDQKWGGGHGLFTYYLLKGMYGYADDEGFPDNKVSLVELESYVKKHVMNESRDLHENYPRQIPFVNIQNAPSQEETIAYVRNPALKEQFKEGNLLASVKKSMFEDTSILVRNYRLALEKKIFFPEQKGNAYSLLQQIKATSPDQQYKEMLQDYIVSLLNDAQLRVNKYFEGVDTLYTKQFFEEGARELEIALSLMSKNHPLYKAYTINRFFLEAHQYWGNYSKYDYALSKLDSALALDSNIAYLYNARGLLAREIDRHDVAIKEFLKAHKLKPDWWFPMADLARCYVSLRKYDEARKIYEANIGSRDSIVWLNEFAGFYRRRNIFDSARMYYTRVLRTSPKNPLYVNNLADLYRRSGKYDSSVFYYKRSLQLENKNARTMQSLGLTYTQMREYDKAKNIITESIKAYSADWYNWLYMGLVYYYKQDYDSAIYFFRKSLPYDPENQVVNDFLGSSHHFFGQYETAKELYQKMLKADPKSAYNWINLGDLYNDQSQYDSARNCYQEALRVDSVNVSAWNSFGNYYYRTDRFDSARYCYNKITRLDPTYSTAYLNLGFVCLQNSSKKTIDSAVYYFKKAISIDRFYMDPHIQLAYFYQERKQPDLALQYLRAIYPYYPKNKTLVNAMGSSFFDKRQYDSVLYYHRKVYSNDEIFEKYANGLSGKNEGALINYYKYVLTRTNSYDSLLLRKIGEYYYIGAQYSLALPYYERFQKQVQNPPISSTEDLAYIYLKLKQTGKAIQLYESMIARFPTYSKPYFQLGDLYKQQVAKEELAYQYYKTGMKIEDESPYPVFNDSALRFVGNYLLKKNQLDEYIRLFRKHVNDRINSWYSPGHYMQELITGFEKAGMKDSAEIYRDILFTLNDVTVIEMKKKAREMAVTGACNDALSMYKQLIMRDEKIAGLFPGYQNNSNLANLVFCYSRLGHLDSAAQFMYRLRQLAFEDIYNIEEFDINMALACYYTARSQNDSAIVYAKNILKYLYSSWSSFEPTRDIQLEKFMKEPMLRKLRETPEFLVLIETFKKE